MSIDRFKFRAWDKVKKEIVFDDYGTRTNFGSILWRTGFPNVEYIYMQCTGLKDSEGTLIYEGDVVEWDDYIDGFEPYADLVIWDEGSYRLRESNNVLCLDTTIPERVLGNIYENPELLNTEEA